MNSTRHDLATPTSADRGAGSPWRRRLLDGLEGMQGGRISIQDAYGVQAVGERSAVEALDVGLRVHHPRFYRRAALGGSVGAAESYIDGDWDCDDLVALVRLLVRNRDRLDAMETGPARLAAWALRGWEAVRPNSRSGSRRNIAAHYDLGNALFETFLSPDMMYSSAIYGSPHDSLEDASTRKLDAICRKLALSSDDHVAEIGTGWGGFALHAARHRGCRVTSVTLSAEQQSYAQARIREAGLQDRISVELRDYRDFHGRFDKLVSIEMIEAIGASQLPTYFSRLSGLLKDDGLALVQAITIEDHRFQRALREVDFIKRHVFPGSFIPSTSAMLSAMGRHSDLALIDLQEMGGSYALTLRAWRQRFEQARERVLALGYDERFIRLWRFYLCYCEGGFLERSIGNVQLLFARPGHRGNVTAVTG